MAYSMMSTTNLKRKFVLPKEADCSIEEKTDDWISVDLEDFMAANDYNDDIDDDDDDDDVDCFFLSSSKSSSSFFSDAASGVPLHGNNRENLLSNKKRKIMETFVDQDLEDTASSPTQSPKVNDFNLFYMKSKEMDSRDICQEIGNTSDQAGGSTNMMSLLESELRKKGLCLIPTTTLLNYLSANDV